MTIFPAQILDIHTLSTGYDHNAEALQLAIVNGDGEVLFNELFKPRIKKRWPKTQSLHGISPKTVSDAKPAEFYEKEVLDILRQAKIIAGYSIDFHLRMVEVSGIDIEQLSKRTADVMDIHASNYLERTADDYYWYDEWGERHKRKYVKRPRAVTMAEASLDFPSVIQAIGPGNAHDAVWGAAASALMYVEMCERGDKGASRKVCSFRTPEKLDFSKVQRRDRSVSKTHVGEEGRAKFWTEEKLSFIASNADMSAKEMAAHFGVTEKTIEKKRRQIAAKRTSR